MFYRYSDDYPNSIYEESLTYNEDNGIITMNDLSYNMQVTFNEHTLIIDATEKETSIKIHAEHGIHIENTISHQKEQEPKNSRYY